MGSHHWPVPVSALICIALLTGCVGPSAASTDPRSGAALAYGLAPAPDQGTSFRPDVVLVAGGAASVRSVTADGLTWTLSPDAPGIGELELGRVMFLTDRAVGRVVAIQNTDAGVEVTTGPVDVTDVIEKGDFAATGVALGDPVVVSQEGALWTDPELQRQAGVGAGGGSGDESGEGGGSGGEAPVEPLAPDPGAPGEVPRPPAPEASLAQTASTTTGNFDLTGECCTDGPGVELGYDKNGLRMSGRVSMDMDRPTADFRLKISGATVDEAALTLHGAAGITARLSAAAQPGQATNGFSPPLATDFSFSVPVGTFYGVPLNMVVTQRFTIAINIPGSATLDAVGKVKLGATIGFSYGGGGFHGDTSATLDSAASLSATNSIAVGISYASFDYTVRATVGFGIANFVAGVYLELVAHVLVAVGAPIGFNPSPDAEDPIEHCKSVQADVWVDYGVGYSIPEVVADVVNFFLKAFQSTPIPKQGGLSQGATPVLSRYEVFPQSGLCVKK